VRDARPARPAARSALRERRERPKHIDVILEMAGRWFAARSFDKAMDELHAHDIPHSPMMSMADIFTDPHFRARQMIVDVPSEIGALPQPGVTPSCR